MKAWELRRTGLDGLVLAERPALVPAGAEVVIGVRAVGLNYRDVAIARGEYPAGRALPLVPGSDVAGVVRAVGPAARGVRPGDRVVASYVVDWIAGPPEESRTARRLGGPLDGGLAEEVVVPDHAIVPLPDAVDFRAAATLPVAGVTAWRALFEVGRLRPGATVLVVGTGGVSTFALQLASAAGARVLVIGGTPAKLERAKALGASAVFSRAGDWDRQVLEATEGRGVDLAIDVAGGTTTARLATVARAGGAVVLIGFLESRTITI
ncbi:MAG TPA: NAD(P)-dependent alcohol dehydrogenase, partial [Anaeromyxobacteraceae bacterium]|nr:NAD(P)-dependent alcohol dehydrogenase [Anaeromyxobacteraceae bacterium]